jgi:hypothetical protein
MADPFARAPSAPGSTAALRPAEPHPGQNGKVNGFHVANGVDATALSPQPPAQPVSSAPAGIDSAPQPLTSKVAVAPEPDEAIPRRRGMHPMAYAFIAAVTVFSGVAAFVLFNKPPPQIVVMQAPATGSSAAPAASGGDKDQAEVAVGEIATASSAGPTARQGLGGARPKASAAPPTTSSVTAVTPIDTSSFVSSVPGPVATATTAPPAGGQLSQGEMTGVVAQNQPRVRRKCWQPALDGQSANGPKNARVTVNITIGASGSVESASASGAERDFPGLASCIGAMVKQWRFPPSGGSSQVTVPFLFAGQ